MSNEHCPICYDSFALSSKNPSSSDEDDEQDLEAQNKNNETKLLDLKERLTIQGCRHEFCRECLVSHCKHAISVKAIPITCPAASAQHSCEIVLEDDFIKDLLHSASTDSPLELLLPLEEAPPQPQPGPLSPPRPPLSSPDTDTDAPSAQESQPLGGSQQYRSISNDTTCTPLTMPIPLADATTETTTTTTAPAVTVVGKDGVQSAPSSPDWIKFQRFQRMLQDPSLLTCTKCQELVAPPPEDEPNTTLSPDTNSRQQPPQQVQQQQQQQQQRNRNQLTCQSCSHTFCRIHGDAHPPHISCDEYVQSNEARQVKKSEKAIRRFTKPCSHCGAPIEKESGCDHIVCGSCHQDMCFKCGTHLHLSGETIRSCEQCQQSFVDHRRIWAYRIILCLGLPCYIPFGIFHILVMGFLAILTCGCCCCFGCGTQIQTKGTTTTTTTTTTGGLHGSDGMTGEGERTLRNSSSTTNSQSPAAATLSPTSTTTTTTGNNNNNNTGNNTNTTDSNEKTKPKFQPLEGMRVVLGLIFLPVVDLAGQCGFRCCCELDMLSAAATSNAFRDNDDDDDDDDDDNVDGYNNLRTDASISVVAV